MRGSVVNGYLQFILNSWGRDGLDECTNTLGIDPKEIKDGRWYSIELNRLILCWISENKGADQVEKAGTNMVKNLGMLGYILRFAKISSILKRLPENYPDVYNFGKLEVEFKDDRSAIVTVTDATIDEYITMARLGSFKGMLDITKTNGTVELIKSEKASERTCQYLFKWE